ncbi:glucose 1-dehydrogenase [Sphingobium sp.]|uniref:SDR family NAD(P)-dependent oxidoreductase n=1 Tax=Sphingobium sp. TaxID=1912891 RepID=UPI002CC0B38F|nr:glucose 1-dehydrogenase [Sphingobium sp.]HUD93613.1 glucose 1-dehydrogenase [Sphingobium sp.]
MNGKSILITGAGGGIGRAAALAFSKSGAQVVAVDLRIEAAEETAQRVIDSGGRADAIACDVSSYDDVDQMFGRATAICGKIDLALNNAGIAQKYANLADIGQDEWHRIMRVNVDGVWNCMRNELKHMSERGSGAIVNMSSLTGLRPLPGNAAYSVSKYAVIGLTKNAAVEYAPFGIRVNAVCPGGVKTAMLTESLSGLGDEGAREVIRKSEALHPLGRLAEPEEVADAAVYLCSDGARFITGVCLSVDGGWAAT